MQPIIAPPTPIEQQWIKDGEHLKLLAVFHFVVGGFALLGLVFIPLHYLMMSNMVEMMKQMPQQQRHGQPLPDDFMDFFIWFYIFWATLLAIGALINFLSGLFLLRRKFRGFSMFVAGVNCLCVPLGTVLGVFTLVVLLRDSVRTLYERQATEATRTGDDRGSGW